MKNLKSIIITTLILTVICAVSTAGLAFTNDLTADRIAEASAKAEQEAVKRIIPAESYEKNTVTHNGAEYDYYMASNDNTYGYIFTVSEQGYGGQIKTMVGIDLDGKIVAVEVLSAADETPGLGQNVAKKSFWEQFKGKSGKLSVDTDVEAVTGATYSSKAVVNCVNYALELFEKVKEGEK